MCQWRRRESRGKVMPMIDSATKQRMPTIMDFNFLPDMGRMSANLLLDDAITYLPVPTVAGIARR